MTKWSFALATVACALFGDNSLAQSVTVQPGTQPGSPLRVKPSGDYSVPTNERADEWQVILEYGKLQNGTFTKIGDLPTVSLKNIPLNGVGTWSSIDPTTITSTERPLHVRARLKHKNILGNWVNRGDWNLSISFTEQPAGDDPGGPGGP